MGRVEIDGFDPKVCLVIVVFWNSPEGFSGFQLFSVKFTHFHNFVRADPPTLCGLQRLLRRAPALAAGRTFPIPPRDGTTGGTGGGTT